MWLVLISVKGGYKFHSCHLNEADARSWAKCKQHDGDDITVVKLTATDVESIVEEWEKASQKK